MRKEYSGSKVDIDALARMSSGDKEARRLAEIEKMAAWERKVSTFTTIPRGICALLSLRSELSHKQYLLLLQIGGNGKVSELEQGQNEVIETPSKPVRVALKSEDEPSTPKLFSPSGPRQRLDLSLSLSLLSLSLSCVCVF